MLVAVDGSHVGTGLGRDVKMTRREGGGRVPALAVAYLCDHETAFGRWPRREGIQRVRFLGRRQRGASRDLLVAASSDRERIQ